MTTKPFRRLRAVIASLLILGGIFTSTGIAPSVASASSCRFCVTLNASADDPGYRPGYDSRLEFTLANTLTTLTQKITLKVTLPDGMSVDTGGWSYWPNNGTVEYDATTRVLTVQPESSTSVIGSLNPRDAWTFTLFVGVDSDVTAAELKVTSTVTWTSSKGNLMTPTIGNTLVFTPSKPYVLETDTEFSPTPISSGGTSVMTSTIRNIGTGGGQEIFFDMYIDDRLTVDTTTVPAGCEYNALDTWVSWEGETITVPQHLACKHTPVLNPGESVTYSVTVTAPSVTGAATFEGRTELSCTTHAPGSHDETDGGDSAGLLLIDPPVPAELHVVQMGGPKPITMPTADAEPQQPTAGKTHSVTTYAYNIGGSDITSDVTITVTIPEGFTPTSISAETDDSGASAPVCTLSTRTCVVNRLGSGKHVEINIEGTLSPTILDSSKLTVSAQASATGITTASDTANFAVTALADVRVELKANGAFVAGSPVAFTMAIQNLGPSGLSSPSFKVTLPAGAKFVSVPKDCTASGSTMTCKWKKLEDEGVDGERFTATFGTLSKASASVKLTTTTPLTKDSVTEDSVSQAMASPEVAQAIATAIAQSNINMLPATGSGSAPMAILASLLTLAGAALALTASRRRTA